MYAMIAMCAMKAQRDCRTEGPLRSRLGVCVGHGEILSLSEIAPKTITKLFFSS